MTGLASHFSTRFTPINVSQVSLSRITRPTDNNSVTINDPTRACKSYNPNSVELRCHACKIKRNPAHVQYGVHRPPQRSDDKSCDDQPSRNETLMIFFFFCLEQRTAGLTCIRVAPRNNAPRRRCKQRRCVLNMTDSYVIQTREWKEM